MTSANLSLGMQTGPARAELTAFKQWMTSELAGVSVSVSTSGLDASVRAALKGTNFGISLDTESLKTTLNTALTESFSVRHDVLINQAHLTEQIKSAVSKETTELQDLRSSSDDLLWRMNEFGLEDDRPADPQRRHGWPAHAGPGVGTCRYLSAPREPFLSSPSGRTRTGIQNMS